MEVYTKGDTVVYPMHGAGVIENLEEHCIDGINCHYYVLRMPIGNLKIMVSMDSAVNKNIRNIMKADEIEQAFREINLMPIIHIKEKWNRRYEENLSKIRSGNFKEHLFVYKSLYYRENQKGLSNVEKKMLSNVKTIILSEIMLAYRASKEEAEEIFYNNFDLPAPRIVFA